MSAGIKVSVQDRKEVERFIRFIVLKTVQVVVQSRLGDKIRTKSKPHSSGSDWFNLSITDLPEITAETKKAMAGRIPTIGLSMCCEISLKTSDGDSMVLETWTIDVDGRFDPRGKASYALYSRLSLLLKSAIAIARVTPAYKLSSQQGPDSYVICYRTYMGEPQYHMLGEDYQETKVGQVITALGVLSLVIAYRTKMTITPQKVEKESPFMVKSDYFKVDMSPKNSHPIEHNGIGLHSESLEKNNIHYGHMIKFDKIKEQKNELLVKLPQALVIADKKENDEHVLQNGICNDSHIQNLECQTNMWESKKVGAFASCEKDTDPSLLPDMLLPDTPFLDLLKHECDNIVNNDQKYSDKNANIEQNELIDCNKNQNGDVMNKSTGSDDSISDDFVMVELRPPFAECDSNSDLGAFFYECQCAPPLASFTNQPTLEEQVTEISCQLAKFETSRLDFDDFVDSLCQVDSQK
ncbi:autophagy-related protein 13-like [Centruroides vittatus]|uniref:autophagy-related protein 13-like n=1 Tax=Centruroides vittatus TaxID=120091 RepID=UPI00350FC3B6